MNEVKLTADGSIRCGGCGRKVRGARFGAQDPAPCGKCVWVWNEKTGKLEAAPRR